MKKTTLLLAVGALAALSSTAFSAALPIMNSSATGNNYVAYTDLKNFAQADAFCKSKQGHLVVFNSNAELTDINKYLETYPGTYWFGGTQTLSPSVFTTVTGQPFFFQTLGIPEYQFDSYTSPVNLTLKADPAETTELHWSTGALTNRFVCEFERKPI